jgi:hypothetical protein
MPSGVDPDLGAAVTFLRCDPALTRIGLASQGGSSIIVESRREQGLWTIIADPEQPGVAKSVCAVLQSLLGFELRRQGALFAHAAAVALNGRVCALLGETAQGKSSLAHLLARKLGAGHVADDLLVLRAEGQAGLRAGGWPSDISVGVSLLKACGELKLLENGTLRPPQTDLVQTTAGDAWSKENRLRLHFSPQEYETIFQVSRSRGGALGSMIVLIANQQTSGWRMERVEKPANLLRDLLEPSRHIKPVTDFWSLGRSSSTGSRLPALRRLLELPTVRLEFGAGIEKDITGIWSEIQKTCAGT